MSCIDQVHRSASVHDRSTIRISLISRSLGDCSTATLRICSGAALAVVPTEVLTRGCFVFSGELQHYVLVPGWTALAGAVFFSAAFLGKQLGRSLQEFCRANRLQNNQLVTQLTVRLGCQGQYGCTQRAKDSANLKASQDGIVNRINHGTFPRFLLSR